MDLPLGVFAIVVQYTKHLPCVYRGSFEVGLQNIWDEKEKKIKEPHQLSQKIEVEKFIF